MFHWKLGSLWLPNANQINTKNMKCTWPTPEFCVGTQHNLYSTGLCLGFALVKMQILGFASAKTQIKGFALAPKYQHVGIPNAKFWRWGHCPTPTPDARYFASQWNIGFRRLNCYYISPDTKPVLYNTHTSFPAKVPTL